MLPQGNLSQIYYIIAIPLCSKVKGQKLKPEMNYFYRVFFLQSLIQKLRSYYSNLGEGLIF